MKYVIESRKSQLLLPLEIFCMRHILHDCSFFFSATWFKVFWRKLIKS